MLLQSLFQGNDQAYTEDRGGDNVDKDNYSNSEGDNDDSDDDNDYYDAEEGCICI